MTEKEFMQIVRDLAKTTGWLEFHAHDSRRSTPGFPDLVLARGQRTIFAELKSEKGKPTQHQLEWLTELARNPANEVYLWRPADLDLIGKVLSSRYVGSRSVGLRERYEFDDIQGVPT